MEEYPQTLSVDGELKVNFLEIPLWSGVQKKPGVNITFPFELTAAKNRPIKQSTSANVIEYVVDSYKVDEYKFITPPPGTSIWANTIGESKVKALDNVFSYDKPPKNILEIGAGSVWVANKILSLHEIDSYVIIDPTVQDQNSEIEVVRDYFPSSKIDNRQFDLIVGFSVLEHVTNPIDFLNSIKRYLTKNGKVVLVFPDCSNQLLAGDINVLIHEHLSYFTESSSQWLASICGFEVNSIQSINDCFTVEMQENENINEKEIFIDESSLLYESVIKFRLLFSHMKLNIINSLNLGKTVGFHGATNGLNTFLYVTGLGNNTNIRIYDGDSSKHGFYLPACISPILSPNDDTYSENNLLVISAMSFYDQIFDFATKEKFFKKEQVLKLTGR